MIGCACNVLEPDEFNTVEVTGELQNISAHEKLRSVENVKKMLKRDEKQGLPSWFVRLYVELHETSKRSIMNKRKI